MTEFVRGCERLPMNGGDLDTADWRSFYVGRVLAMNLKKVYRLHREERLIVRKRGGRKRAFGTRAPMAIHRSINSKSNQTRPLLEKCVKGSLRYLSISSNTKLN